MPRNFRNEELPFEDKVDEKSFSLKLSKNLRSSIYSSYKSFDMEMKYLMSGVIDRAKYITLREAREEGKLAINSYKSKWNDYAKQIAHEMTIFDENNEEES